MSGWLKFKRAETHDRIAAGEWTKCRWVCPYPLVSSAVENTRDPKANATFEKSPRPVSLHPWLIATRCKDIMLNKRTYFPIVKTVTHSMLPVLGRPSRRGEVLSSRDHRPMSHNISCVLLRVNLCSLWMYWCCCHRYAFLGVWWIGNSNLGLWGWILGIRHYFVYCG